MVNTPRNNLPTWIPEWLIQTTQMPQKEQVNNLLWLPKLDEIKQIPQRAPSNSNTSLLAFLWYHKVKGIYPDFVGKKVLDIWWGFGGVASNLWASAESITVVDPIFQEKNLEKLLAKNLQDQEEFMSLRKEYWEKNKNISNIKSDICEGKLVYKECSWWENYTEELFPNVVRNHSYGEHLVGIDDHSQDIVFLNFVLSKTTVDHNKVLQEVWRVLKHNGIVIISDNDDKKWLLYDVGKQFILDIKHQDKKWFLAQCSKK